MPLFWAEKKFPLSLSIENLPMLTGEQLRFLRQARQLKQKEMARQMGISQQRYSALENNEIINGEHVKKILVLLKFSAEDAENIFRTLPPPNNNFFPKKIIPQNFYYTILHNQHIKENDKKMDDYILFCTTEIQ